LRVSVSYFFSRSRDWLSLKRTRGQTSAAVPKAMPNEERRDPLSMSWDGLVIHPVNSDSLGTPSSRPFGPGFRKPESKTPSGI
jgi:hypothetical protein